MAGVWILGLLAQFGIGVRGNLVACTVMKQRKAFWALSAAVGLVAFAPQAKALPGFFATNGEEAIARASQVTVMKDGDLSVVSVTTDYDGPMDEFALVIPVPSDVTTQDLLALKRGDVERLEQLTAPRFHEFWEMDPCEPGKPQQLWEINMSASQSTDFLGGGDMFEGTTKAPKEMRVKVEPEFRPDSEYTFSVVSNAESFLKSKGLKVPEAIRGKLGDYNNFIVAMVDAKLVEVGAKGEAMLSPVRFSTRKPVELATSLGTPHIRGQHELLIYVLDTESRYEVANFENVFPPTNLLVDLSVKERTGEFYAAVHDKLLEKHKDAFLTEYSWDTKSCGEPCPNAPLHLAELLTLGADVHERSVSESARNPEPKERSEEEQAAYDAAKPDEKKKQDELRKEVARRQALIARRENYTLTRLHHRYAKLDKDVKLKPASAIEGGTSVPVGAKAELPQNTSESKANRFQTRIVSLHPSKSAVQCDNPERHRWGRPPTTYRGARKIWVADRLAWRDRDRIKLEEVAHAPIAALGIQGVASPEDQAASAAASKEAEAAGKDDCDCRTVGATTRAPGGIFGLLLLGLGLLRRRRS